MKYLGLTLLVFFICFSAQAQEIDEDVMINKSVNGYIIFDASPDTLWGKVKISTRANNQVRVKFIEENTSKEKTYKAKDEEVIGYGYRTRENNQSLQHVPRWRHFLRKEADQPPAPFTSRIVFMEAKSMGEVNLYSYYIQSNSQVKETYLHYYLIEQKFAVDVEEYRTRKVTRDNYETIVQSFTEDCPKVENVLAVRLDYSNLDHVIDLYNECQYEKVDGGCGECAIEAAKKAEAARKLREERAKQEQIESDEKFKSSKNKKNSKATTGHK